MLTKEYILMKISQSKEKGITRSEIYGENKELKEAVEQHISDLIKEGKVIERNKRIYLSGMQEVKKREKHPQPAKADTRGNFITREEVQGLMEEAFARISGLKEEIDRLYDYISDVFVNMKKDQTGKRIEVGVDELMMVYDNLNSRHHYGDSLPLPVFKREVMKTYPISEKELDEMLLNLYRSEAIYLQVAGKGESNIEKEHAIEHNGKVYYFITWVKR